MLALTVAATATASCSDEYVACFKWAADQYCKTLPSFMREACPASCGLCEPASADPCVPIKDAVAPGAIAAVFGRAAALEEFSPSVLSTDPFIVTLDSFAPAEVVAEIAEAAESVGFGASGSSCAFQRFGCNSASMSCLPISGGACWAHESMRSFEERMRSVLQVPAENCEPLRFFRYGAGESFGPHHDAAGQVFDLDTPGGPRVWTMFVFLAAPKEGGDFRFPLLNISVPPKPGRAILWPHLMDSDLVTVEERTQHEGTPVIEGLKMGVNLHAHRNNLRTLVLGGCRETLPAGERRVSHTFHYESSPNASPLHDVIGLLASGAVPKLIEAGADIEQRNGEGSTPLTLAAGHGLVEAVRMLLKAGADIDRANGSGATPLMHASYQGHSKAVQALIDAGASLSSRASMTALHLASKHGQLEVMQLLLASGAEVDAATARGTTPLQLAARQGELDACMLLLEAGATVDLADGQGLTALHVAAGEGHADVVRLLLDEGGATINAADQRGRTAVRIAQQNGHREVAKLLAARNAGHLLLYVAVAAVLMGAGGVRVCRRGRRKPD